MNYRAVLVVAVLVSAFGIYATFTYPRTITSFPVSFAIGADTKQETLTLPVLHGRIRVEVVVTTGSTWWTANIVQGEVDVWSHSMTQNDQTIFQSDWIELSTGQFNFTYTAASLASLELEVTVTTKGGFW